MTIWFGINEYHFECKGDINRPNCTVVQRKPEKKNQISRFEPLKNPRPWCITVKDLKLSKVAVGCPIKRFSPTQLLVLSRTVAGLHV